MPCCPCTTLLYTLMHLQISPQLISEHFLRLLITYFIKTYCMQLNLILTDLSSFISSSAVSVQCSALFTTFIATNLFTLQPQNVMFTNRKQSKPSLSQLLLHLESNVKSQKKKHELQICSKVFLILNIPGEPHGGEVSPAELPNYMVFSIIKVSYFHMVVAT